MAIGGDAVKDSTILTLGGYLLSGWIVSLMLIKDGEIASGTAAAVAVGAAGLGSYLGKRANSV